MGSNRALDKISKQIDNIISKGKTNKSNYLLFIDDMINKGNHGLLQEYFSKFHQYEINNQNLETTKQKTWELLINNNKESLSKKLEKLYKLNGVYQSGIEIIDQSISYTLSQATDINDTPIVITDPISISYNNDIIINILNNSVYKIEINSFDGYVSETYNISTQSSITTKLNTNHSNLNKIKVSYDNLIKYDLNINTNIVLGTINEIESISDEYKYYYLNNEYSKLSKIRKTDLLVNKNNTELLIDTENVDYTYEQNLYNKYKLAIEFLKE